MSIKPDPKNANKGTQRGRGLLEKSLRQYGAGRSVLADKHGTLIAGNKTADVAAELGLPHRIIQTDGHELIVVQRTDLDLSTDTAAVELGIADNRVGEVSLDWDVEMLAELSADVDLSQFWNDDELSAMLGGAATDMTGDIPLHDTYKEQYGVIVMCESEMEQRDVYERFHAEGLNCRVVTT